MDKILRAANAIEEELAERVEYFKSEDKLLEAQRIAERTNYDVEMLRETGFCSGVENYSRHLAGMPAGATPHTLMDYFGDDYLLIIDESHKTVPQVRAIVRRRPVAEDDVGRLWFSPAVRKGQPSAEF